MDHDEQMAELFRRWKESVRLGNPQSLETLCGDCPEMVGEFRQQLPGLVVVDALFSGGTEDMSRAALAFQFHVAGYQSLTFHREGGLSIVLLGEDCDLKRIVALKWLKEKVSHNDDAKRRFRREAEITSSLDHPGIIPVYARGTDQEGRDYYVMRFVQGETLQEAIDRYHAPAKSAEDAERDLQLRGLLRTLLAVCETVAYAHSRKVVHRDLKPLNIMRGAFGETLVLDWGLAKRLDELESATGKAWGTPGFMSPEQLLGDTSKIGPAADIYSLGATLQMILIGSLAAAKGAATEFGPGTHPALAAVCRKAMSPRPQDRYGDARELARDLERWLSGEPVSAYREPWWQRIRRGAFRLSYLVAAVVGFFLLGIVYTWLVFASRSTLVPALILGSSWVLGALTIWFRQNGLRIPSVREFKGYVSKATLAGAFLLALSWASFNWFPVRRIAVWALYPCGELAAPLLVNAALLDDQTAAAYGETGWEAVHVLEAIQPSASQSVPALTAALSETTRGPRERAAVVLGALRPTPQQALEPLLATLRDGDKQGGEIDLQESAALGLTKIGPPAVPALCELLHHENPRVRHLAIQSLAEIGPAAKEAIWPLAKRMIADYQSPQLADEVGEVDRAIFRIAPQNGGALRGLLLGKSDTKEGRRENIRKCAALHPQVLPAIAAKLGQTVRQFRQVAASEVEKSLELLELIGPPAAGASQDLVDSYFELDRLKSRPSDDRPFAWRSEMKLEALQQSIVRALVQIDPARVEAGRVKPPKFNK